LQEIDDRQTKRKDIRRKRKREREKREREIEIERNERLRTEFTSYDERRVTRYRRDDGGGGVGGDSGDRDTMA